MQRLGRRSATRFLTSIESRISATGKRWVGRESVFIPAPMPPPLGSAPPE